MNAYKAIAKLGVKKLMILAAPLLITALLAVTMNSSADGICRGDPFEPEHWLCY